MSITGQKLPVLAWWKGGDNKITENLGRLLDARRSANFIRGVHDYDDKSPHY